MYGVPIAVPKEAAVRREEGLVGGVAFGQRTRRVRSRPMPSGRGRPRGADGDILS